MPVKDLVEAKQRLVPALTPEQRRALAAAMLEDVLGALAAARLDAVWVVTRDAAVTAIARRFGATAVTEAENRGHTAAVAAAQARARAEGVSLFATIPGDVPCVTAAEVDALLDAVTGAPAVAFAASRSGAGTNGVAMTPADAMPLRFGEPSFDDHLAAARARGLTPRALTLPGLELDIDGPEDLELVRSGRAGTHTARLVAGWDAARPRARAC